MLFGHMSSLRPTISSNSTILRRSTEVIKKGKKRRSHLDTQAEILKILASEYLTMNQIVIRANLNRPLTKIHINQLLQKGHLEVKKTQGFACYSASQKGIAWVKRFEALVQE
jgi:predicted transcriptional regulator